jgi:hypothetical protein
MYLWFGHALHASLLPGERAGAGASTAVEACSSLALHTIPYHTIQPPACVHSSIVVFVSELDIQ